MRKFFVFCILTVFCLGSSVSAKAFWHWEGSGEDISFVFVGDILLASTAGHKMKSTGNLAYPFEKVKDIIS